MAENTDEINPALQYVVFVTSGQPVVWLSDEASPEAIEGFVADSLADGWPVWRVGHTAYVFSVGGLS